MALWCKQPNRLHTPSMMRLPAVLRKGQRRSGDQLIFGFQVVTARSTEFASKHWRHWEGEGSAIQRFSVTLDIAP